MSAPILIAEREPVFPCWLWHRGNHLMQAGWHHSETTIKSLLPAPDHTHWFPDQPAAPTVRPVATNAGLRRVMAEAAKMKDADAQPAAPDVATMAIALGEKIELAIHGYHGSDINSGDIAVILTPALSRLVAERDAARLELARVKASDDFNWKILRDCMDELEMKDMGPSMMRGEIQEWKLQAGYLKEKEVRATDRTVMLNLDLIAAREREGKLREALAEARTIAYKAPELNMSNYDHEQVRDLNDAMIALFQVLDSALLTPPDDGTEKTP